MQFLKGKHISYDIVLVNSKIVWWTAFRGYYIKNKTTGQRLHGTFNSWKHIGQQMLPGSIWKLVSKIRENPKHRSAVPNGGYFGCLNVECIGDKIIEAHLRMGDIDQFNDQTLMENIVRVYAGLSWKLPRTYAPKQSVHLFPIWGTRCIKSDSKLHKKILEICSKHQITKYYLEDGKGASPSSSYQRLYLFTGTDYKEGLRAQKKIYQVLLEKDYV
jgi:hypothetical protein